MEQEGPVAAFSSPAAPNQDHLCDVLRVSPRQIWAEYIPRIIDGLWHPFDREGALQQEHASTLRRISTRLPYFVQNIPRDWKLVGRIATKAWKRYQYIQHQVHTPSQDKEIPATVKIAIFGGSVTEGVNCGTSVRMKQENCAWAMRLEYLVNRLAGGVVIEVWNGAIGGTNTQVGAAILKFELPPENMRHPDIIINAYSVNDMHILTMNEAKGQAITLRDHIFQIQQEFVRIALQYKPCQDAPLVIFLDDYLGNEQREIMSTVDVGQSMQLLASYYGIGTVSYANMVRDIVYKNTRETSFSPAGWYRNRRGMVSENMLREIHPGAEMHVTVALSMSYYFMVLASAYCSMERTDAATTSGTTTTQREPIKDTSTQDNHYPGDTFDMRALPPLLSPQTTLDEISQLWNASIQQVRSSDDSLVPTGSLSLSSRSSLCQEYRKSHPPLKRCIFSKDVVGCDDSGREVCPVPVTPLDMEGGYCGR